MNYDALMNGQGRSAAAVAMVVAVAACCALTVARSAPDTPARVAQPGSAAHGKELFEASGCSSCHAATFSDDAKDGRIRAGHPLEGAPSRGTWWNGRITTDVGEASDFCLRTYLDPNSEGLTAVERKALVLFMQELGSERGVSPLALLRRDAGDVDLRSGDAGRGRGLYRQACGSCHGSGLPIERALTGNLSPAQLAEIIRKGTARMPFFQVDRLSSPQVADIATYLESVKVAR
jgi:mono/diheme cytochrome c family protein